MLRLANMVIPGRGPPLAAITAARPAGSQQQLLQIVVLADGIAGGLALLHADADAVTQALAGLLDLALLEDQRMAARGLGEDVGVVAAL